MSSPTSSYDDVSIAADFAIRPLKSADIPRVCELHADLLNYPPSASFYRQFLLHSGRICLVAHPLSSPETPIAFVTASIQTHALDLAPKSRQSPSFEDAQVQVLTLGVDPQYRRRGIARRLVLTAVHKLQESEKSLYSYSSEPSKPPGLASGETVVTAHVATSNEGGKQFYEAIGLSDEEGVEGDLYRSLASNHRDALVVVGRVH